jgi:hypothetical protein
MSPPSDTASVSSSGGESTWDDAEQEQDQLQIVCLFDDTVFPSVKLMFDHCKAEHHFDILDLQKRLGWCHHSQIQC